MSNRRAVAVIAGMLLLLGVVVALWPTTVRADVTGQPVGCGSALVADSADAESANRVRDLVTAGGGVDSGREFVAECDSRIAVQRWFAFPLIVCGGLTLAFVALTTAGASTASRTERVPR